MGYIAKKLNGKANQELAAPVVVTTTLTIQQVIAAMKGICEDFNSGYNEHYDEVATTGMRKFLTKAPQFANYHVIVGERVVMVAYAITPERLAAMAKKPGTTMGGWWTAQVRFPNAKEYAAQGQTGVELTLMRWVTDGNGRMKNRDHYTAFADRFFDALQVGEPAAPS